MVGSRVYSVIHMKRICLQRLFMAFSMNFGWILVINSILELRVIAESLSSCPINCFERRAKIFNFNQIYMSLFLLSFLSDFELHFFSSLLLGAYPQKFCTFFSDGLTLLS